MEASLTDKSGLKLGSAPASLTGTPIAGARVGLKFQKRVSVVVALAASAAAVLTANLLQHDAASSGNSKALAIESYFHKVGSETSFTKVALDEAEDEFDLSTVVGNNTAIVVFNVLQEELDVNNNFDHISLTLTGDATARLAQILYVGDAEYLPAYELDL